jgi:hypothetical protein
MTDKQNKPKRKYTNWKKKYLELLDANVLLEEKYEKTIKNLKKFNLKKKQKNKLVRYFEIEQTGTVKYKLWVKIDCPIKVGHVDWSKLPEEIFKEELMEYINENGVGHLVNFCNPPDGIIMDIHHKDIQIVDCKCNYDQRDTKIIDEEWVSDSDSDSDSDSGCIHGAHSDESSSDESDSD